MFYKFVMLNTGRNVWINRDAVIAVEMSPTKAGGADITLSNGDIYAVADSPQKVLGVFGFECFPKETDGDTT